MPQLEVVLYHDVLCSWCYLADQRLSVLRSELGDALDFSYRAYPIRPEAEAVSGRDARVLARHYRRVAREPGGEGISPDLWLSRDPPASTLPPLVALEAARLQGTARRDALLLALRDAAFRRGINVSRRDILIELGQRVGLDVDRFLTALDAPATEQAVRAEHAEGHGRGVRGVPTLFLNGEAMVTGARALAEYRKLFRRHLTRGGFAPPERLLH
ncbi:MAG: DsbA family oxidoreductase [Myxococcales bacterium]